MAAAIAGAAATEVAAAAEAEKLSKNENDENAEIAVAGKAAARIDNDSDRMDIDNGEEDGDKNAATGADRLEKGNEIVAAKSQAIKNQKSATVAVAAVVHSTAPLLSVSLIYTQGCGPVIGVALTMVIRQYATLIVMTKMIRHISCRTIGVAYNCINNPGIYSRLETATAPLSYCETATRARRRLHSIFCSLINLCAH